MRRLSKIIQLSLIVAMLFGCWGRVIDTNYYQLDYVPTPKEMYDETVYPYSVRIRDFDVADVYRRNNIVYRQSPYKIMFYHYEQWAVKPEYMVSDLLFRHLEAAKIFSDVRRGIDMEEPDFTINGIIRSLEEYDNQDEWYAHLAINMSLHESKTRRVVWNREWDYRKKVSNWETVYVIRGLSELLEHINNEAVAAIDSVMRANFSLHRETRASDVKEHLEELEILPPPEGIE
jgi:ABC-type uncharacterized transport system auxiliary subunit